MSTNRTEPHIVQAALHILDQGEALLETVPTDTYTTAVSAAFGASIGMHYRHCLDYYVSFQRALDRRVVDYDARDRDPRVERDPDFARQLTRQLRAGLGSFPVEMLSHPIAVRAGVSHPESEAPVTQSTLGRELAYVIAHAIHHYALIAVVAALEGVELPPRFGVAPSTLRYRAVTAQS